MRISDWSSDVCSSDLRLGFVPVQQRVALDRVVDLGLEFQRRQLQQVQRLAQLRRQDELLAQRCLEAWFHLPLRRSPRDRWQRRAPTGGRSPPGRRDARPDWPAARPEPPRSEEHTSELQSLMRISYAVFCLKKKKKKQK